MNIYYVIKQYLKHENIWRQNMLLKQKKWCSFLARLSSSEQDKRRTVRNAYTKKPASVFSQPGRLHCIP